MIRSVHLRQFLSSITIFMLVWCQTSAVAQASLIAPTTPAVEVAVTAPCHQTTTDIGSDTTQQTDCQTRCQSHNAWFETANIHLPAIDDLPLAMVCITLVTPVVICTAPNDQTAERAAPPPLILVYGRLLI
jgi:hypothetical protein